MTQLGLGQFDQLSSQLDVAQTCSGDNDQGFK